MLSKKYEYISSSMFDQTIIEQLAPAIIAFPTVRALRLIVDVGIIFAHLERLIKCFEYYVEYGASGDLELHFAWKLLIESVLQRILRDLPDSSSSLDLLLLKLFRLGSNKFGDSLLVIPPVDLKLCVPDAFDSEKGEKMEQPKIEPKSGDELLEEYWNAIDDGNAKDATSDDAEELPAVTSSPTRKRKRRRDASDVFEVPKRFCPMKERDIILVFHHTAAVVRPLTKNAGFKNSSSSTKMDVLDRKKDSIWRSILKGKGRLCSKERQYSFLPVDLRSLIL